MDFVAAAAKADPRIVFASPGAERQDSVYNGLEQARPQPSAARHAPRASAAARRLAHLWPPRRQVPKECTLVAVHDAARPLVTIDEVHACIRDAAQHGAAVLAVPMKATVKESDDGEFVGRTLERSRLWEIQTPQIMRPQLLRDGFTKVRAENLEVTDDVSIVEQMGEPVKLTLGEYTNLKLTTPEDMVIASRILQERAAG